MSVPPASAAVSGDAPALAARTVVCLTSHNRIDCARINQELIKLNYRQPLPIVHASSAADYEPCLEDRLLRCPARPMSEGAVNLLQCAMQAAADELEAEYLVHLEADTWLMDETVIHRLVGRMQAQGALLCASGWGVSPGVWFGWSRFAALRWLGRQASRLVAGRQGPDVPPPALTEFGTQFFILHRDALPAVIALRARPGQMVEKSFFDAFVSRHGLERVLPMSEREPVHPANRHSCEALALYAQHWPARGLAHDPRSRGHLLYVDPQADGKREVLQRYPDMQRGPHLQRLLTADQLDYYNRGALRY